MNVVKLLPTLMGVATIGLSSSWPAQAALMVNSQSAVTNLDTQEVLFTIDFNEVPDFSTVDEFGRQADSFQYFVDADGELPVPFGGDPPYSELETIIRGGEIYVASDIPVRDVLGEGGPNSGGWGPIRGSVPFALNDTVLTFSAPLQLIGDSDGLFSYELLLTEFGGTTDVLQDRSVPVPEPSSTLGIFGIAALGTISLLKCKQKKSQSTS